MPKQIYSEFLGGISYYDRNAPANTYYEGREIDPHRGLGYLQPGWLLSTVTKSNDATVIITGLIVDMAVHPAGAGMYFLDDDRIYEMTSIASETWESNFDGSSHYYYDIGAAVAGTKLAIYAISGTNYLLYAYRTATGGDVGIHTLDSTTFNDDYLSTDVGTGNAALQKAPIDMLEWKSYMFISHGRYVGRFDGPNDTWDATKLDLGVGWEVSKLFSAENYLGICAAKKVAVSGHSEKVGAGVFFWDGTSTSWTYWKPIDDYDILTAINKDGEVLLITKGKDITATLRKLTDFGTKKIRKMKVPIAGTMTNFSGFLQNGIDTFGNRVIFGSDYLIFSYGQEQDGQPMALTIPWGKAAVANQTIASIKTVLDNKIYIGYKDITASVNYLLKATTGASTRATYRGNYFDAGQKIRVNYVKFYFKTLVASDDVTVSLDTDYGTSNSLGDITYTSDGAVTSKRFNIKKDCHAFRPVISWSAGGVAFSKIVVDYDFLPSDV